MQVNVTKNDETKRLLGVEITQDNGDIIGFSPLDVGYTLSQVRKKVLVGDNTEISPKFPDGCIALQIPARMNLQSELETIKAEMYFDADGQFAFPGVMDGSPDKAANEFAELYKAGKAIFAPAYMVFEIEADKVLVREEFGNKKVFYVYNNDK